MPPALIAIGTFLGASASTAAVVGGLAVAGTAGVAALSISSSRAKKKAAEAAQSTADETRRTQNAQIDKLEAQQKEDAAGVEKRKVRDTARNRQKQRAASARGRRGTILTDPIGDAGPVSSTRKTLIGG